MSARSHTASSRRPSPRGCPTPTPARSAPRTRAGCARSRSARARSGTRPWPFPRRVRARGRTPRTRTRTARPGARGPATPVAGRAPATDERGLPSANSLDDALAERGSAAARAVLEHAREAEVDYHVEAPTARQLQLRPVTGAAAHAPRSAGEP